VDPTDSESPPVDEVPDVVSMGTGVGDNVTNVVGAVTGVVGRETGIEVVPFGVAFTNVTGGFWGVDVGIGVVFICAVLVHPAAIIVTILIIWRRKITRLCISV
jgi:hypothetical protein